MGVDWNNRWDNEYGKCHLNSLVVLISIFQIYSTHIEILEEIHNLIKLSLNYNKNICSTITHNTMFTNVFTKSLIWILLYCSIRHIFKNILDCGGTIFLRDGEIRTLQSSTYTQNSPSRKCIWLITTTPGYYLGKTPWSLITNSRGMYSHIVLQVTFMWSCPLASIQNGYTILRYLNV